MGALEGCGERLKTWVNEALGEVEMSFEVPSSGRTAEPTVFLYAVGVEDLAYRHGTTRGRAPQGFRFRYVVATGAPTAPQAQELLGELLFSAMDEAGFDVDLSGHDSSLWQTFGIPPRPSFFLLTSVERTREEFIAPRIQEPPRLLSSVAVPLVGKVIGPGSLPLMRARVELPAMSLSTYTDADGYFRFPAVAGETASYELRVHARGTVRKLSVKRSLNPEEPLLVPFEL
ncbi:MAG: hypothetical protein AAGM22_20655 [Acidobacteriota bacterium]